MQEPAAPEPLVRQLSVAGIWLLAINGTIGAGIFGAPGAVAAATGIHSPLVFLLCGVLMAPIVLSFAEVASAFRGTGGPVLYAQQAFGAFAGFQTGWAFWVARVLASAANVNLLVATLGWFAPAVAGAPLRLTLLLVVTGALTWVNLVGTRHAMRSLGALTLLKFLPLLAVGLYGLVRIDAAAFPFGSTPWPSLADTGSAVMLAIYAFVGWESALVPAGESRDPARDMPRALLWALATATLLYVLIQTVSVAVLPDLASQKGRPLVAVGEALFGPAGAALLTIGIVVSVGGNVASATMTTPRITYAMARNGTLPRLFGVVHAGWKTPSVSIAIYGLAVFALAAISTFVELAVGSVLVRLLIYLAVILALPRIRRRVPAGPGRLRLPGGLLIPVVAGAVCAALVVQVDVATALSAGGLLLVGTVLFLLARWGRRGRR